MNPREELLELTRQVRAWVEWLRDSGVDALHGQSDPRQLLALLEPATAPGAPARRPEARARARPTPEPTTQRAAAPAASAATGRDAAAAAAAITPAERDRRLERLAEQVKQCTKCRLHEARRNPAFSRGRPDAELVFVGEGPGAEEDRQGLPFVGPAGQLLDKMIVAMGYQRDDVYICNIVKCRPPKNRKPTDDEIAACTPYLREQLDLIRPKVIVALGATGVQGLLGTTMGITRMRGTWKLYRGRTPLMPTFHPAYLLRSPEKKRDVWNDLKAVMLRLGRQPPPPKRKPTG